MHKLHELSRQIEAKESQLGFISSEEDKLIEAVLHEIEALKCYRSAVIVEEKERFIQELTEKNLNEIAEMRKPKMNFISNMKARLQL